MYTIAPRVGSRCQYVCASCLNATIRRGESGAPRSLRQNSTVAEPTNNAESESPKAKATGPNSLSSRLGQAAKKKPKAAQAGEADKIATPVNPSRSSKGAKPKGGQIDPKDQTSNPLKTSNSIKGLPRSTRKSQPIPHEEDIVKAKTGKKPSTKNGNEEAVGQGPSTSKKRRKKRGAHTKSASPEAQTISNEESIARLVQSTRLPLRSSRPRLPKQVRASRPSARRVPSSLPITRRVPTKGLVPSPGTPKDSSVRKRRGPLLTYLYSITSTSAGRFAKRALMKILEEKNLLNRRGLKMSQEGEDIFKDAARKEIESTDQTLSATLLSTYETIESALKSPRPEETGTVFKPLKEGERDSSGSVHAQELRLVPVEKPQPPVPGVVCGLERVLFNQGVYRLRDPHTRVYNFDPYLESITPVKEFDYNALKEYITSSRDKTLIETAVAEGSKYTGSTSSMTSALAHFHYLLSKWRPVNHDQLSRGFPNPLPSFTAIQRAPAGIFLRRRNGVYAIDANKGFDTSNVLQWLGKSMEKFLTADKEEYIKYRKENSHTLTDDDKNSPESYHYTTFGDFLMRSQLDAHDPRLPGTGMYDLKTRAVVSIRRDATDYEEGLGYEITSRHGEWDSYEREFYDMSRSAFLKYSLQVRMGRMDGIFVAFHNTERIFGFQYLPLPEMDQSLHGSTDTTLGDSEFKVSLELLNKVLDRATEKFPEESLEVQFETRPKSVTNGDCFMYIFVRPVKEDDIQAIQEANIKQIQEYERRVIGLDVDGQEAALRAAIESAAEVVDAEDQNEILENAFNHLDESASVETIRNAFGKVDKGTPVEKALNKMLDLLAARTERNDEEAAISSKGRDAVADSADKEAETTTADAEPDFNAPVKDAKSSVGRVAVFKLNIRNFVNGHEVLRPEKLKPTDDWKVEYGLQEMEGKIGELYEASVKRREDALGKSHVSSFMNNKFGGSIQDNVNRGKEYRKKMDMLDEEHGVQVYDKQEFLNFESLEKREAKLRKDVEEEEEELKSLKEAKEHAVKV